MAQERRVVAVFFIETVIPFIATVFVLGTLLPTFVTVPIAKLVGTVAGSLAALAICAAARLVEPFSPEAARRLRGW